MKDRIFLILLLFVLGACSSSPDAQQVTQSNNPSPSPNLLPTDTAVPSPTTIPSRLEQMPEQFNQADVVAIADTTVFQITRTYTLAQLNDWQPANGKTYLIMEGIVFNYSEQALEVYRTHFEIEQADSNRILPNLDLMAALQENEYTNLNYPGRRNFSTNPFIIEPLTWKETFLAYEIPSPVEMLRLSFTPQDRPEVSLIEIWFLEDETDNELRAFKAYDNGEQQYTIDFNFDNRQTLIEEIIDEEIITVDNCFGTEVIDRTRQFSETTEVSYTFGSSVESGFGIGVGTLLGNSIIGDMLSINFSLNYEVGSVQSVTETIEETLRAAPQTLTRYQLTWYRVTLQGVMQLQLGGENFYIPYALTNRLRADLVSLPAGTCPQPSQEN